MVRKIKLVIVLIFFLIGYAACGQEIDSEPEKLWFINVDIGMQMSGIKDEDFVESNYSPLIRLVGGKWFNKFMGLQMGYQGRYFNAISDNDKHFYDFYFTEGIFNVKNILLQKNSKFRIHDLVFHLGLGYFQNHYYGNSTFHGILGLSNQFSITQSLQIKLDVGAIVGWDIYQGNDDILPSISIGILYKL